MANESDNQDIGENTEQKAESQTPAILTGRARSLANLRPPFKKGEIHNPTGRPPTPITDAYRRLCKKRPVDKDGKKNQRTYAQLLAEGQFRAAIKGKTDAAKEITERLEGKAPQAMHISGPDGDPITVNIDVKERLRSIAERIRNRPVKSG